MAGEPRWVGSAVPAGETLGGGNGWGAQMGGVSRPGWGDSRWVEWLGSPDGWGQPSRLGRSWAGGLVGDGWGLVDVGGCGEGGGDEQGDVGGGDFGAAFGRVVQAYPVLAFTWVVEQTGRADQGPVQVAAPDDLLHVPYVGERPGQQPGHGLLDEPRRVRVFGNVCADRRHHDQPVRAGLVHARDDVRRGWGE